MKLQVEYVPISTIKPYKRNAKLHPQEQIEQIKNSMKQFGNIDPIGVWHDEIVEGHGRYEALKQMGVKEIPIIRLDDLTDEQRKAYALAHNKLTMNSDFDLALLDTELAEIETIDMTLLGFDEKEPAPIEVQEDDFDEEPPVEPIAKYGDIYQLGNHRLMCGDSTKTNDVECLMGGHKADMVFTDPPYNVAIGSKNAVLNEMNHEKRGNRIETEIRGDLGMTDEEIGQQLWFPAFTNMLNVANDDCALYVTMPQGVTHMTMMMMVHESGWQVKHELMWLKSQPTFSMNRLDYDYKHEPILYGWNKKHEFYGNGKFNKSVWEIEKPRESKLHPTMKPIELIVNAIQNSSKDDDIVLDVFGGSGSTLIACEQTNRKCFMMELDPKYVDVIINRWETFTGKKAELIGNYGNGKTESEP